MGNCSSPLPQHSNYDPSNSSKATSKAPAPAFPPTFPQGWPSGSTPIGDKLSGVPTPGSKRNNASNKEIFSIPFKKYHNTNLNLT